MEIIEKEIEKLIPYALNSRTHSDEQIAQISASIKEFGFNNPILIDEKDGIIAGHGRVLGAKKLGLDKVPTIKLAHLTPNQRKAYIIADNKLALNAGWDMELLNLEMGDLKDDGFDLSLLGFDDTELANIFVEKTEGLTDPDAVPDMPDNPVTKEGDVWLLGKHRLMCGDSTSIDAVDKMMDGVKADMVFTDPPYNANYKSRGTNELLRKGIKNDAMSNEAFDTFILGFLPSLFVASKPGASFYICCNWKDSYPRFYNHVTSNGMNVSSCIVWNKGSGGMGWQDYRYQYELIIYGFKKDSSHSWYGGRKETDIWDMKRESRGSYIHPTQKPVELIERALKNSSKSGDVMLDLFGGSGSSLIACEINGREARLIELDPKYCDVIVKRWQDFTGEKAKLEDSGEIFPTIKADAA
tara:strand:+ start:42 stop:1277 length:1236 start_codon:yes stop_codon:yes gene_type:complete